jgi:cytochrome P450
MQRKAIQKIVFKDGSTIPKGAATWLSMESLTDPKVYPNPHEFNPYRFLQIGGKTDSTDTAKFVTVDPHYLGFGYGRHACPGRYLASNEIKILMCHLLIMYDWKFSGRAEKPKVETRFIRNQKDPRVRILCRKRNEQGMLR